jgi:hypothetical protein
LLKDEEFVKKFTDMVSKNHYEYDTRKDLVTGVLLAESKLNGHKAIDIVVKDPAIIDDGFFWGKHMQFTIETAPLGWVVFRKDKDFNILRDYLLKAFPHILIPAVPVFHVAKQLDKNFTRKRESLLNRFMNKIMCQDSLRACKMVVDFLSCKGNIFD